MASAPHGQLTDITNAMVYGITAFTGFEAAAALGEEARPAESAGVAGRAAGTAERPGRGETLAAFGTGKSHLPGLMDANRALSVWDLHY